jgi:hypothetical protein
MAHESPGHTLQTALVHEARLRLVGDANPKFHGRAHFFAAVQAPGLSGRIVKNTGPTPGRGFTSKSRPLKKSGIFLLQAADWQAIGIVSPRPIPV